MKTITLAGNRYHINITGPIHGLADNPNSTIPSIVICQDLKTKSGMETVIHEASHVLFPGMSEERITRSARDLTRLLWGLGYRLKGNER